MLIGPCALTRLGAATAAVATLAPPRNLRRVVTADLILFHIDFLPCRHATLFVELPRLISRTGYPSERWLRFCRWNETVPPWPDPSPGTRVRVNRCDHNRRPGLTIPAALGRFWTP